MKLLAEGGAPGHMFHPFDLSWVNSGNDLIDFFERSKQFVEKEGAGAVKIDGTNVSFKVVEIDGQHQFAVDRGSLAEIDISGITIDRVDQRFPEGHGMRPAIKTLLTILNQALSDVKSELESLGMWNDPSKFLNTEYVEGVTNVTEYDENFFAIHGLNQFYEKTAASGPSKGNYRPGLERPMIVDPKTGKEKPIKDPSREIPYNPKAMESLVEKLRPYAKKYNFEIYSSIPTERITDSDIDFSSTLSQPLPIARSEGSVETKTLKDWLSQVSNPRYNSVKLKNGKTKHALHRDLYIAIVERNIPVDDLVEDQDVDEAIQGAVIMHATRMLGNDVLNGLTSPMGDVMDHEGVVLRDKKIFGPKPVKITGEFIVGGMESAFQADTSLNETIEIEIEDEYPNVMDKVVVIYPGRFQPMGKHHAAVYNKLLQHDSIDDVFIVTSDKVDPPDSPFNYEEKKQIIKSHGIPEDRVYKVKSPYKAEEVLQQFNPATTAAIFVIGKKDLNRLGGTFFRPWKGKAEVGYRKGAYTLVAPHESLNIPGYGEMSGTTIRAALSKGDIGILKKIMGDDFDRETVAMIIKKLSRKDENVKTYKKYLTEVVNEVIFESNESSSLLSKLSLLSKPSLLSELSKPSKPKTFYDIALLHGDELEEEIEEEEELEELSGAAGSGGYAGQFPGKKHSLVREEEIVENVLNYLLSKMELTHE
tara:strand:+ start:470 stop:2575 length:2106 start_codon:yes stop_codon:yes gene_type:complete